MVYYVKYWIIVRQETPDVKLFVVCGNSLSAPYLLKINTVRGEQIDLPSDLRVLDDIIPRTVESISQCKLLFNIIISL